jgi:ATP-binding cassette subfamily B protein
MAAALVGGPSDSAATAPADLAACLWPLARRDDLASGLARAAALAGPLAPAERFELAYADVAPTLSARARAAVPAVLRVGSGAGALVGVVGFAGAKARLVAADGAVVTRDVEMLAAWLRGPAEAEARPALAAAVAAAGLPAPRVGAVTDALCRETLGAARVAEGERLRVARPSFRAALASAGAARRLALGIAGYLAQLACLSALWWAVGARALAPGGRLPGLAAVIAALVGARLFSSWLAGRLAIDVGEVLRDRLMGGILALDTEPIRAQGIGQLLGRVVETEALEALALGGGLMAAAGLFELLTGAVVVALGLAARGQLPLLGAALAAAVAIGAVAGRRLARWSELRVRLTHDLVERMVGQRTLVAQQPPELRHRDEHAALEAYAAAGRRLDRALTALSVLVPRGWLLVAVAALAPWLAVAAAAPGAFAASLGGALFIYGALRKLTRAFPALAAAVLSQRHAALLFAAPPPEDPAPPASVGVDASLGAAAAVAADEQPSLVAARDLSFRYPGRARPVLSGCALEIRRGDRVLLEGPSGGGKSTLGALLAGLRLPDAGTLHLAGVDRRALGARRWRARIGAAPQFHENHVFSASLLFNLLLGRAWPPRREDVAEAEAVLRELDLAPLVARMPSGLEQLVGESGWQLSHGERSRVFIARALLQPLDARVLDESFAALDPETLEKALACVLRRADTLVVIAHP